MRKLTPDERRVWEFVTKSVTPLRPRHAPNEPVEVPKAPVRPAVTAVPEPPSHRPVHLAPLQLGRTVDIDAATARKFKRGQMPCDAKLDLHGLTLAQAHGALTHFIRVQSERGARSVLVITGKGSRAGDDKPRGRIKAELMHWLNAAPLRAYVLAVTEAGPRQGGTGATYVLLKRRRD